MKIGVCGSPEQLGSLPPGLADYGEGHVQNLLRPEAPEAEFAANLKAVRATGLPMPAANCFLPGDLKVVGPDVDGKRLVRYADRAFRRAKKAGIELIVFGSGAARMAPEGWSLATAFEQYVGALRLLGPVARQHGIMVVVEPLERGETNVVNTVLEGAVAVARAGQPGVRLLVDIFHMLRNGEPADDIVKVGKWIRHAHIAEKEERTAPGVKGDDFRPYLAALRQVGYRGLLSLECNWKSFASEAAAGVEELRRQLKNVGD